MPLLSFARVLLCSTILVAARFASAQSVTPSPAARLVMRLEDTLNAAWLRHDTITVGRLIVGDFHGTTARGRAIGRSDMLRAVGRAEETATDVTDRTARELGAVGDVVVTTGRITDRGRRATGEAFTVVTLVTNVWIRRSAGWKLVASHESLAPQ